MSVNRRDGWLILLISAAALAASVAVMAPRISAFNRAADFKELHFEPILARHFTVYGRAVALTDAVDADGRSVLHVRYGDDAPIVFEVPVRTPPAPDLPDLGGYDEWCNVLALGQVERDAAGNQVLANDTQRVVIVSRQTPEGYDPQTWGIVRQSEWTFDFYDLRPDGSVDRFTRRWPRSYTGERSLQQAARAQGDKADPRAAALSRIEPLQERSWEFQAALHVSPKLSVPSYKFQNTAFDIHVLGWTLPVGMFAVLGVLAGLAIALSPRRADAPPSPAGDRST